MAEQIRVNLEDLADVVTMNLFIHDPLSGALLNAGGDALVLTAGGLFEATLGEDRAGMGVLRAVVCEGTEDPANVLWTGWLPAGDTLAVDDYPYVETADVKAQLVEALSVDMYPEPVEVPNSTTSILDRLRWMFVFYRNRQIQTASVREIYADDGVTLIGSGAVDDNGVRLNPAR